MEINFTDLLRIFFISLCVVPIATINSPPLSIPATMSWATRTSATKRNVIQSPASVNDSTAVKSCPLKKGVLDLGKFILLDDCGRLECVEEATGLLTIAEVRCRPPNEQLSLECQWTQTAVLKFPECCVAAITCERNRKPSGDEKPPSDNLPKFRNQTELSSSIYRFLPKTISMLEPMHSSSSNVAVVVIDSKDRGNGTFRGNSTKIKETKTDVLYINNPSSTTNGTTNKKNMRSKIRGYDYRKFIERAKHLLKTNISDPKPSFFLPIRRRKPSSNETIVRPQITNVMFIANVTTAPARVLPEESKISEGVYARRRLSSLLSDQSARRRLDDKFVPIIAATSEQQKSFLFSKINPKSDNETVTENSNQITITSSSGPPKTRTRKPHWELNPQKQGKTFGTFESRRKLFSNRLHKFMNGKSKNNETNTHVVATKSAVKESEPVKQTTVLGTKEPVLNSSASAPRVDSALSENLDDGTNKIQIEDDGDRKNDTEEVANIRAKIRGRIKIRRKNMPIPRNGNVRDKRLLEILTYEAKRNNLTGDVVTANEPLNTEIPQIENNSAKPAEVSANSTTQLNVVYQQRRRMNPKERIFLHIKPINRTKFRMAAGSKLTQIKIDLNNTSTVTPKASEAELETVTESAIVSRSRPLNKISIPVFKLKDASSDENKVTSSRGKMFFDLSKRRRLNDLSNTAELAEKRVTSRGRTLQAGQSVASNDIQKISENEIEPTKVTDATPPPPLQEEEEEEYIFLEEPPPGYDPTTDPDYPPLTPIKSSLEDFDRHYPLPDDDNHRKFYDLDLSSSDADISKLLGQEENEVHDEDTKIPMKVTTVVISQSQNSYRSSTSRDTAKNFKETPIYESKTYYKNVKKPVPQQI